MLDQLILDEVDSQTKHSIHLEHSKILLDVIPTELSCRLFLAHIDSRMKEHARGAERAAIKEPWSSLVPDCLILLNQ